MAYSEEVKLGVHPFSPQPLRPLRLGGEPAPAQVQPLRRRGRRVDAEKIQDSSHKTSLVADAHDIHATPSDVSVINVK
jgi:hypothetical protein